jgi:hypothetical protein
MKDTKAYSLHSDDNLFFIASNRNMTATTSGLIMVSRKNPSKNAVLTTNTD